MTREIFAETYAACKDKGDLLCTFGFQDNAAYLLKIPEKLIEELLGFKKDESNKKKLVPKKINSEKIFSSEKFFVVEKFG